MQRSQIALDFEPVIAICSQKAVNKILRDGDFIHKLFKG